MNKLIILSGPGGCGKDAILFELLKIRELRLIKLINITTRKKREGEIDGKDYNFISTNDFETKIKKGEVLEYEVMSSNQCLYGTDRIQLEDQLQTSNVISNKMPGGALVLKKMYDTNCITIFIDATDEELIRRLNDPVRGKDKNVINARMLQAKSERKLAKNFDFIVFNHDHRLDEAVEKIKTIIKNKM